MDREENPPIRATIFGASDVGLARIDNEDSFGAGDLDDEEMLPMRSPQTIVSGERGLMLVVCDGMGGAAAGEIASSIAVDVVFTEMRGAPPATDRSEYARLLRRAVRAANRRVFAEGARNWKLKGMGTTLSAAGLIGSELVIAQIGDSRGYVLRGDELVQVTRDQSIVSALLHAGKLAPEEASGFIQSNVILQALGVGEDVNVALSLVELRRGDRLLLCSDGLHGSVDDQGIVEILCEHGDPRAAVAALIEAAREAGGPDNITALIADFDGDALEPAEPDESPRFLELDPMEDGERAVTTTSKVARRLAARAGVVDRPRARVIPATGLHESLGDGPEPGPAEQAVERGAKLGTWPWIVAALALLALAALALLWGPA